MRETEHALSGGLGAVERRGADADESHHFDSQARLESADGGAGRIPQADEPVVHQDDARTAEEGRQTGAQGSHGKTVQLPLMDRQIPIILDDLADPEFGPGVVKVPPAHDLNDFEAGKRHNLPKIKVIDENAVMTALAGPYANLDRFVARKSVVADLEKIGALVKIED